MTFAHKKAKVEEDLRNYGSSQVIKSRTGFDCRLECDVTSEEYNCVKPV